MTAVRRVRPRPGVRLRRAGVLTLLAGALVLTAAPPALAHDGLVSTSPADTATVAAAPVSVELAFTGEPLPLGTEVAVTGPDGLDAAAGPAEIRGATVVQPLEQDLSPGTYRVDWRSTSSDGHPLSGTFGFTVGSGDVTSGPGSAVAAAAGGSDAARADTGLSPVWPIAAAVVLVGLGLVFVTRLRRRP